MQTNEILDMTYKVRYFNNNPLIPPSTDSLPIMNYTQAINIATRWIRDDQEADIFDGSLPIFHIGPKGIEFVKFELSHAHFEQHLKIKIALDKVWGEHIRKRFQI